MKYFFCLVTFWFEQKRMFKQETNPYRNTFLKKKNPFLSQRLIENDLVTDNL